MSVLGLRDPSVGMMAASVLLVSCTVGVDMQQDRSTAGGSAPTARMQFRYQAVGIVVGAALCVVFARLFMTAYPVLRVDTFTHPEARVGAWQSAMTFKFVGALRGLGHLAGHQTRALGIGFGIGFVIEIARKLLGRWRAFVSSGGWGSPSVGSSTPSCCRARTRRRSAASSICRPRRGWPSAASWRRCSTPSRAATAAPKVPTPCRRT